MGWGGQGGLHKQHSARRAAALVMSHFLEFIDQLWGCFNISVLVTSSACIHVNDVLDGQSSISLRRVTRITRDQRCTGTSLLSAPTRSRPAEDNTFQLAHVWEGIHFSELCVCVCVVRVHATH